MDKLWIYLTVGRKKFNKMEVSANVAIQHKESFRVAFSDLIAEMVDSSSSSQRSIFLAVSLSEQPTGINHQNHVGEMRKVT